MWAGWMDGGLTDRETDKQIDRFTMLFIYWYYGRQAKER